MPRTVVDTLAIEFDLDDKDLTRGLKRATKNTQTASSRMGRAMARFERKVKDVGRSMLKFRTVLGLVAGAAGLGFIITKSIDAADSLAKTADKVGLTTDSLQELRFGAELAGVGVNTMDMAMQRFSRRVGEVAIGTGELKGTFERLGISVENSSGKLKTQDQLLNEIADAIMNAGSEQERLSIAFKAFDSEGAALVNMLKDGAAGLDAYRKRANELGLVLDEKLVRGAESAKDRITELKKVLQTAIQRAVLANADQIAQFAERIAEAVPRFISFVGAIGKFLNLIQDTPTQKLIAFRLEIDALTAALEKMTPRPGDDIGTRLLKETQAGERIVLTAKIDEVTARFKELQLEIFRTGEAAGRFLQIDIPVLRRGPPEGALLNRQDMDEDPGGVTSEGVDTLNEWNEAWKEAGSGIDAADRAMQSLSMALSGNVVAQDKMTEGGEEWVRKTLANIEEAKAAWGRVKDAGVNAIEAWLTRTKSLKESFKGLIADLARMIIKAQIFRAVSSFGGGGGPFGAIIGRLFGGSAGGGAVSESRPILVGERGPEIFNPPSAGRIINNADTRSARGGGPQVVINADMRGASVDAVVRLERFVMQLNGSVEPRAIAAVARAQRTRVN